MTQPRSVDRDNFCFVQNTSTFQTSVEQRGNSLCLRKPCSVNRFTNPEFPAYKVLKVIPKHFRISLRPATHLHGMQIYARSHVHHSVISHHLSCEWDLFSDAFSAFSHLHMRLFSIFYIKLDLELHHHLTAEF